MKHIPRNNLGSLLNEDVKSSGGWLSKYEDGGSVEIKPKSNKPETISTAIDKEEKFKYDRTKKALSLDPAFFNYNMNRLVPTNDELTNDIKDKMKEYVNSDLFTKRLSDNYIVDKTLPNSNNIKANDINVIKKQRLTNIKNVDVSDFGSLGPENSSYSSDDNLIHLGKKTDESIEAHELGHAVLGPDRIIKDYKKQYKVNSFLNDKEVAELIKPLKVVSGLDGDSHYNVQEVMQDLGKRIAAGESYGDLNSIRYSLNKYGVTKKFGDNITQEHLDKASKIKEIKEDPSLKRLRIKYKDADIIRFNNTIASNNNGVPLEKADSGGDIANLPGVRKVIPLKKQVKEQSYFSQYTPKVGDQERMNASKDAYRLEESKLLNRVASSKVAANAMNNIVEPMITIDAVMSGIGVLPKLLKKAPTQVATQEVTRGPIDWAGGVNRELNPNFDARAYENTVKSPYVPPITGAGAPYIKKLNGGWLNKYE